MIILATDARTDIGTSTARKGTEAGSMTLDGVGTAIAMIDMAMMHRTALPGNLGGPETSNTGTLNWWIAYFEFYFTLLA